MAQQSSSVRLRQIALVTNDLKRARQEITDILGAPVIYEDPTVRQWGLENFLVPLGGDIIEVVAPTRSGTTAGRLLDKRGEGGYMIIMQTEDADARSKDIVTSGRSKVIFQHPFSYSYPSWNGAKDEGFCIQYHPKGIAGGMMPELDSHKACERNPRPLTTRFSPWHPCGPDYDRYLGVMKSTAHLHLRGCLLNLDAGGKVNANAALQQWSETYDIPVRDTHLVFTNAQMSFARGHEGRSEGLLFITIRVDTRSQMQGILDRARAAGKTVHTDGDWFEMVGVRWNFWTDEGRSRSGPAARL
ncbi:uncharacterized protein HMPREF1541_09108 [Cyphellophora europaea CBS 101466]|uniref:Glyoxalase-like domain-containing protein n=1 Tax=Cyphellophora europaea (strain CBS 101466) TaxID=1220924 RepID=W2S9D0_CYPE1|nr:uncharacterized protein HMPREF1541_09108 [Cyphellophora europaea CBS 101466]ETN45277.1 hypothetical protein HMPREF1541_09108 [Cyphellophora europaea CBS 101466]